MAHWGWTSGALIGAALGAVAIFATVSARPGTAPAPVAPPGPPAPPGATAEPWAGHLARLDAALAARDATTAADAWFAAYRAARAASRRWQPMLAVGDAALRLGPATAGGQRGREVARTCYLSALLRARDARDVDGVAAAAAAFAALGDAGAAAHARAVAARLIARDGPAARERLERALARASAARERAPTP